MKINLYGSTWDKKTSDAWCKNLSGIEWVYDNSSDKNMYVNESIPMLFQDKSSNKKYAWLNESRAIDKETYATLEYRLGEYLWKFDRIFTHDKSLYDNFNNVHFVPLSYVWIKEPKIHEKTKLVSMIASNKMMCYGHYIRLQWVEKLKDKVDLYGVGFNKIANKEEGLKDYMFSVAIENDIYESCFTEKIMDCFATGTIPVYLGPPDIGDFFNADGIITLTEDFDIDTLTPELYYSKMEAIKDNFERVKEYDFVENYMYRKYLCQDI